MNTEYREKQTERRKDQLDEMFTPKPYSKEWSGLKLIIQIALVLIQVGTAACAIALPADWFELLFGSWIAGLAVGLVAIAGIELIKRYVVRRAVIKHYTSTLGGWLRFACIVILFASVLMSYFGTPILVEKMAPVPQPPVKAQVLAEIDSMERSQIKSWVDVKSEAVAKSEQIHAQNNWKGVTTRDARNNQLRWDNIAAAATDSINGLMSKFESQRSEVWATALADHQSRITEHDRELEDVGLIFALICLGLEVLFYFGMIWLIDYQYHEHCELNGERRTTKQTTKPKVGLTKPKAHEAPAQTGIGFITEGKITDEGWIYCKKANGELKAYSASQLGSLISNTNGDRAKYYEKMRDLLNSKKS